MDKAKSQYPSTEDLFNIIQSSPESFFDSDLQATLQNSDVMFTDFLKAEMAEANVSPHDLIIRSTLSKSHLYLILSGERHPSRDIVIVLAIALGLPLDKTQRMLKLSQKSELYPRVRRDAAIMCCIEQSRSLTDTNEFLTSISEKALL